MPVNNSLPQDAVITPSMLKGTLPAIASKSAAHRMLIAAALSDRATNITCSSTSDDIEATKACLKALGARITNYEGGFTVSPLDRYALRQEPMRTLLCGESGSTLRFMVPVAAALGANARFSGEGRLPARPMSPLREELIAHGCEVSPQGMWPLTVAGSLQSGVFVLPGNVSSQFVTGLLLALPVTGAGGTVLITGTVESKPYIDLTCEVLRSFGAHVTCTWQQPKAEFCKDHPEFAEKLLGIDECEVVSALMLAPGTVYTSPGSINVEGDWSNSAFWLAAGALGEQVCVKGLCSSSTQGDKVVVDILQRFGASVQCLSTDSMFASYCAGNAGLPLKGIEIDVHDVPDLVPVLAVVAATAQGTTVFKNAARLRLKESDRIATTTELLEQLGARVESGPDTLKVWGTGTPAPEPCFCSCTVDSHGDHRLAMAAAVAACRANGPVHIKQAQVAAKSYPTFYDDYRALGGNVILNP